MPVGAVSLLFGVFAALAAIRVRGRLTSQLGRGWLIRYMVVQVGLINIVLLAVVLALANGSGWTSGRGAWIVPVAYGVLFFFYSLSNIDWTVKKFHSSGE